MGKRRFAGSLSAADHSTSSSKFSSQHLTAWVRGWDGGVEIVAGDYEGRDCFEIWICGGSNDRSRIRKFVGRIINDEFVRKN